MKKKAAVLRDNENRKSIINAVINALGGTESVEDINRHGIDGGYSGFIYNSDTHRFAMKNRKMIVEMLEETAEMLGEDVVTMVSNFGVFRNSPMDREDKTDLYKYLGGGKPEQGTITNVMAWFAAEEVCRMFED